MVVETGMGHSREVQILCEIRAAAVSLKKNKLLNPRFPDALGAYLNSLSSSTTWTPFSKLAVPFCPADAKWPLTAILSGAVYARFTAEGLVEVVKESGDCGEERVEYAMTAVG